MYPVRLGLVGALGGPLFELDWLAVVTVALTAAGLIGYRSRDVPIT